MPTTTGKGQAPFSCYFIDGSHFRNECEHGVVVSQCRCFSPDKAVRIVPCPPECSARPGGSTFELTYNERQDLKRYFEKLRDEALANISSANGRIDVVHTYVKVAEKYDEIAKALRPSPGLAVTFK